MAAALASRSSLKVATARPALRASRPSRALVAPVRASAVSEIVSGTSNPCGSTRPGAIASRQAPHLLAFVVTCPSPGPAPTPIIGIADRHEPVLLVYVLLCMGWGR